jgi:hypothetical protein
MYLASFRKLTIDQEGFDEFTVSTNHKTRESFEPLLLWNLRFGIQPAGEFDDLIVSNFRSLIRAIR